MDALQAVINIYKWVSQQELCTLDISKCYDVVPIDPEHPHSIPARLHFAISQILQRLPVGSDFSVRRCSEKQFLVNISDAMQHGYTCMPMRALPKLLHVLLSNCYILFRNEFWLGKENIPQGLRLCPDMTNLHLLTYGVQFVLLSQYMEEGRYAIRQLYTSQIKFLSSSSSSSSSSFA
jgi:hypothetical protein